MSTKKSVRLSPFVKPERYQLTVKPDLEGFVFEGEEVIHLELGRSAKEITLHSKELKIFDVEFQIKNFKFQTKNIVYDKKSETASFIFNKNLPKGKGQLKLKFKGILNDKMRGFYRSSYQHNGKQKHMATTQFEATDARAAFPCFDEPAQKAIFDVTLIVPKHLTAISNTIESEILEHESGYKVVKFAPTPKMSTYLLAFIVGDFEFIEGRTKPHQRDKNNLSLALPSKGEGTLVRVFVTPGKKHQAKFALDTAVRALEFYNKYFDIPYPLPVLDLIAIPDFSHGAMENWGAVTYRESALLVDPENSSASNKQWVALVIAHELAHQWFGNLVTMEWWTHLWLNEGFASYIEYLAVDHLFPAWDIWTQFAYADLGVALKLDSLKNTHPIEVEVHHPDEIGEIFDEISYSKGASVIRMLAGYLGEKDFRDGLRYYLKKHSYTNASTVHLWQAFEKISKKPVEKIMKNWTGQGGYPMVKITQRPKGIELSQKRFFSSPLSKSKTLDKTIWKVPIAIENIKTGKKQNFLLEDQSSKTLPHNALSAIKINPGETGFYRVDYPAQMLAQLKSPIQTKKLRAIDRLGIIRDAFALAEAGELPTAQVLNLLPAYENETDYTVWVELSSGLAVLRNLLFGQSYYPEFEKYCQKVFERIGHQVGWQAKKGESHTQGLLRSLVLNQLSSFNHKSTLAKGNEIYKKSKNIPADIRSTVYQTVAHHGSKKQFAAFVKRYNTDPLSEEKNRVGRALGQFQDVAILKQALQFAMSNNVRIQDTAGIFASVWNNPHGKKVAWEFTKKNWKELLKRYPSSGHMMSRFIKPASGFVSSIDAKDFANFFKKHSSAGADRSVAQVLEKIQSNDAWLKRDGKHIENWLKS